LGPDFNRHLGATAFLTAKDVTNDEESKTKTTFDNPNPPIKLFFGKRR
jgi:hypothetical protein